MSIKLKDKAVIDADKLDGKDSSQFSLTSHTHSGYASSMHNHDQLTFQDTRNISPIPRDVTNGIGYHLKSNNADGLNDGHSLHGVLSLKQWNDITGGAFHQLGFTNNGNIYSRYSTSESAWSGWNKVYTTKSKPTPAEIGAASSSSVNNNMKLGQYIKFYDYDDNGSETTVKQAYLRDGKWVTNFTDMVVSNMNIASEINNLKSSVSSGKNAIASAITAKGIAASGSDSHATLANKISQIASVPNMTTFLDKIIVMYGISNTVSGLTRTSIPSTKTNYNLGVGDYLITEQSASLVYDPSGNSLKNNFAVVSNQGIYYEDSESYGNDKVNALRCTTACTAQLFSSGTSSYTKHLYIVRLADLKKYLGL